MSCFPEYRYAIYVDGELAGQALREVQAHLVGCRRCRALVVALEEEAALLGEVLHDRAAAWRAPLPGRARARGVAVGIGPALGAAALVATVGGWLLERELPSGLGWLNPIEFVGATEMLFDLVFVVRDLAPDFFDLVVAVGALAAFAAVGTLLTGLLTRRLGGGLAPLVLLLAVAATLAPGDARAFELRHEEDDVRVAAGETVAETLVASADAVDVDGRIDGDLVVLAERFVLTGEVAGNLYVAAREVDLRGSVGGSAHVVGERVDVQGAVARGLYAAAETLTLRPEGSVGWDVLMAGEHVRAEGRAGRDLTAFAEEVEIRGSVARNASAHAGSLVVHSGAQIAGDLEVHLPRDREPEIASGATVGGEVRRLELTLEKEGNRWADPGFYLAGLVFLASAFLAGMALHTVAPRAFDAHVATAGEFFRCLGLGFVGLVATPLLLVLCLVTVVGIPIGVIGFFVYLTALFLSVIVVGALVGSALLDRERDDAWAFGASLLLGLAVVLVAANLPFLGGLLKVLILLTGLGLLLSTAHQAWQERRGALPA